MRRRDRNRYNGVRAVNYRLIVLSLAALFGLVFSVPSFVHSEDADSILSRSPKINLGLDLRGGLSLLLGVDVESAVASRYASIASNISYEANRSSLLISALKSRDDAITFSLLDASQRDLLMSILSGFRGISVDSVGNRFSVTLSEDERSNTCRDAVDQAIATIRNRLDRFGLSDPSVSRRGVDKISVDMPGIRTTDDQQRLIDLISKSAKLHLMAVDEDRNSRVMDISDSEASGYGDIILPYPGSSEGKILLKDQVVIDGSMLTDAQSGFSRDSGESVVNFTLDSVGAKIFGDFSGNNVGKRMAIVLDGRVFSAPVIRSRIGGGNGQISGNFTPQSAHDLAITLKSGALLAPISVIEMRSVGPSLGSDSIRSALIALLAGFVLVVAFMIMYYGIVGLFACISLLINLLLIIAVMALFGATLTLPGMAGIVLTVGMAVDANIIINERIREAMRSGMSIVKSITTGYASASRAILDANITSLIASFVLYAYGTGAIKGFAITTGIGIMASIVTAVIGTHGIYLSVSKYMQVNRIGLWFGISKRYLH